MEHSSFLFVANWKMQKSFEKECSFIRNNATHLGRLVSKDIDIVLCPSFVSLASMYTHLRDTNILLGAQDCSEHDYGPYTGQTSAWSLAQVGCTYCLVGHSERRQYNHDTNAAVARKVAQALAAKIRPIICIGETADEHQKRESLSIILEQLKPIFTKIKQSDIQETELCIAYYPIWSIGTGIIPSQSYLYDIFSELQTWCHNELPQVVFRFLYGGSINDLNVVNFYNISLINGLLIGSASLDFQKFKKIVSLLKRPAR